MVCRDSFTRWKGPGNTELREKIANAFETKQIIRLIIAHTSQTKDVQSGVDAKTLKKTFHIREDLIGEVATKLCSIPAPPSFKQFADLLHFQARISWVHKNGVAS